MRNEDFKEGGDKGEGEDRNNIGTANLLYNTKEAQKALYIGWSKSRKISARF